MEKLKNAEGIVASVAKLCNMSVEDVQVGLDERIKAVKSDSANQKIVNIPRHCIVEFLADHDPTFTVDDPAFMNMLIDEGDIEVDFDTGEGEAPYFYIWNQTKGLILAIRYFSDEPLPRISRYRLYGECTRKEMCWPEDSSESPSTLISYLDGTRTPDQWAIALIRDSSTTRPIVERPAMPYHLGECIEALSAKMFYFRPLCEFLSKTMLKPSATMQIATTADSLSVVLSSVFSLSWDRQPVRIVLRIVESEKHEWIIGMCDGTKPFAVMKSHLFQLLLTTSNRMLATINSESWDDDANEICVSRKRSRT